MESVYTWVFGTGSEKMETPPTDESEVVGTCASALPSSFVDEPFDESVSTFVNTAYNVSPDTRLIDIYINKVLDTSTVTPDTVRLLYQSADFPFGQGSIPIAVEASVEGLRTRVRIKF